MNHDFPVAFRSGPFRVGDALAAGVPERWLGRPGLVTPIWGVRAWDSPKTLLDLAKSHAAGVRGPFAFSHTTAAQLLGVPLSYAIEEDDRLHIMRPTLDNRPRRDAVCGHRGLEGRRIITVHGLPVVAPEDTWVDLGELVGPLKPAGLDDLIVAGDAVANLVGSRKPLKDALERRRRRAA